MPSSLLKIAEQCRVILNKGDTQSLIASVIDVYGALVKKEWYENKQDSCGEVDGVFISTFKNNIPILDIDTDYYYIIIPSSYLRLPHEMGINFIGFAKNQSHGFIRINAGSIPMWANLKAGILGGGQTYFVEGNRMYFPKMTTLTNNPVMLKLSLALDTTDVEADLNIPPSLADQIVNMVVQKYMVKEPVVPEKLN